MNEKTKTVRMSTREEIVAKKVKQLGETTCIVETDGKRRYAVYHPILDTLFVNDLNED